MPDTQPMDGKEITRTFGRIEQLIAGVHTKLDDMPDWKDIDRQESKRDKEQAKQDEAIGSVESKVTTLMFAIIGTALTAAVGVLRTL